MKLSKKSKKAGVILGIFAVAIIMIGAFLPGFFKPSVAGPVFPREHLFVDATYLLITEEKNDSVHVSCDLYLTNIWEKESGKINVVAYVIEETKNFAVYKTRIDIGNIKANSTAEVEIPVVLENSSYKVEILLFENEKIVTKGKISIRTKQRYPPGHLMGGIDQQWEVYNEGSYFANVR